MREEKACRRSCWGEGLDITLADGQVWRLPRPRVRYTINGDGVMEPVIKFPAPELDPVAYTDQYRKLDTADDGWPQAVLDCARHLLLSYYDLTPDEVKEILQVNWGDGADGDAEGVEIRKALVDVIHGRGPTLPKP